MSCLAKESGNLIIKPSKCLYLSPYFSLRLSSYPSIKYSTILPDSGYYQVTTTPPDFIPFESKASNNKLFHFSLKMEGSKAATGTPRLDLIPKIPNDYYYGTRRFSNNALHFICCCALFSTYDSDEVARFLRGDFNKASSSSLEYDALSNKPPITQNSDLRDVEGPEVRGCFFQMLDDNHGIYQQWSHTDPKITVAMVNEMVQPLKDAGESHIDVQRWNAAEGIAKPIWKRGDSKRSAKWG